MGFFTKILIFLSSIVPMLTLFLLNINKINMFWAVIFITLGFALTLLAIYIARHCAVEETKIISVDDKSSDIMFTLISYMLIPSDAPMAVIIIYILFVAFAFWYSKIYFSNIYTALLGIRCYSAEQNNGKNILILKKGKNIILDKKTYRAYFMTEGIYLWEEEDV